MPVDSDSPLLCAGRPKPRIAVANNDFVRDYHHTHTPVRRLSLLLAAKVALANNRVMAPRVVAKLRAILRGTGDRNVSRIQRRRKLADIAWRVHPRVQ